MGYWTAPCLQRGQPRLGIGDKLPQTGFGARVLRKSEDRPHPHDAVPKPSLFVLTIGGHKASVPHDHDYWACRQALARRKPAGASAAPGGRSKRGGRLDFNQCWNRAFFQQWQMTDDTPTAETLCPVCGRSMVLLHEIRRAFAENLYVFKCKPCGFSTTESASRTKRPNKH
jgi:predicted RNA-binding Zn-ribbon protein involved in translation (DUF1610 family)